MYKVLLISLSQSEREGRGGGWRDNVKESGVIGKGRGEQREGDRVGRGHGTSLITAL